MSSKSKTQKNSSNSRSRSRSRSKTPSPRQQKIDYSKSLRNLGKVKKGHFTTQQELKAYLEEKCGKKKEDISKWWTRIIKIHPDRIHPKIIENKRPLFDGKNRKALNTLVAIKQTAKDMEIHNKTEAKNFIKRQQNKFLKEDPEVSALIKSTTNELIEEEAKKLDTNDRLKKLGISAHYPVNDNLPSDIKALAQLRSLDLQKERDSKRKSSKRGGRRRSVKKR